MNLTVEIKNVSEKKTCKAPKALLINMKHLYLAKCIFS